ncbi:Protocatechuate 3,4-dioxygenase beta chain [Pseudovibrio axinellae]|uniref:Protocatechuate 3,4-dioxygenase beta chain n=1 Tax=Pseudovibrio axinellae TaxID=989403 RepID=A0A166BD77_9HYPH|nr:protocatechuate 3,4-dioxygenase subunit beta [Pseudovibrio axinellae]KZL22146.1 Protocatechuate 3,4-dioxygenase beta chain [Pseudovibrio axinellae]SEQ53470.1 protocatechuate 3,4-dioxygenase, beta subunit [Pseudovibrio axinellae]
MTMTLQGRLLEVGPTDNTSDQRTPRKRLRLIPQAARESFVPYIPQQAVTRQGENDLTRIAPGAPRAQGTPIEVSGRVCTQTGQPVRHALLEIWNANMFGRYTHIEDHSGIQLDPNFLGLGRVTTDDEGRYTFWTISPGAYLARPDIGRYRPKHIHISLSGGSSRLITQMYFPGEENNATDPMATLMGDAFERNVGQVYETPHIDVHHGYRFDIVVGGRNATFFED